MGRWKRAEVDDVTGMGHRSFMPVLRVLQTNFNNDITYHGCGMGIREISKENEDLSENNKTKT